MRKSLETLFAARGIKASPESLQLWLICLGDLSVDEIEYAVVEFSRTTSEYPTPAGVRRFVPSVMSVTDDERAVIAWDCVRKAVRTVGAYRTVCFDDRIINATLRQMGGWVMLCDTRPEEMKWKEREFAKRYALICKTGIGNGRELPGILATDGGEGDVVRIGTSLPAHRCETGLSYSGDGECQRLEVVEQTAGLLTVQN